jgi:hypothetical protein
MNEDMAAVKRVLEAGAETGLAWELAAALAEETARKTREENEDAQARERFAEMVTGGK